MPIGAVAYPAAIDSLDDLMRAANNAASTLASALSNSATSLTLVDAAPFPSSGAVSINNEIIYYSGKSGNTLTTLVRGREGTTAVAHNSGDNVRHQITARYHTVLAEAVRAVMVTLGVNPQGGFYPDVRDRLRGMGQWSAPQSGVLLVNQYIDQAFGAAATSTLAATTNSLRLTPFFSPVRFSIDQMGVSVSTGATGNVKYGIYNADPVGGAPNALLLETASVSTATTGHKTPTLSPAYVFEAGLYWLAVAISGVATMRTIPLASLRALGPTGADATSYAVQLVKAHTFANALPNPYSLAAGDFSTILPYAIRMRVASVG